jgi:hypothetical protein
MPLVLVQLVVKDEYTFALLDLEDTHVLKHGYPANRSIFVQRDTRCAKKVAR